MALYWGYDGDVEGYYTLVRFDWENHLESITVGYRDFFFVDLLSRSLAFFQWEIHYNWEIFVGHMFFWWVAGSKNKNEPVETFDSQFYELTYLGSASLMVSLSGRVSFCPEMERKKFICRHQICSRISQWPCNRNHWLEVPIPHIRPIFQAYFSGNIPRRYGQKYGTFTYLHQLDPEDLPLNKWYIHWSIQCWRNRCLPSGPSVAPL